MPYRALPDSDLTRIAAIDAIDAILAKADTLPAASRPYPAALHTQLIADGPIFKGEVGQVGAALSAQGKSTNESELAFLALQTVISHFIQVLNLAIARGAFPREARPYYQLDLASNGLPPLTTRAEVTQWAGRIITGEAARTAANPTAPAMANPSADEVDDALTAYQAIAATHTAAKDAYDSEQEDVFVLRPTIDALILDLWDNIEFTYRADPGPSRRRKCREWGIVYVNRPGEAPDPEEETPEIPPTPPAV